jgi:hypothetical protein
MLLSWSHTLRSDQFITLLLIANTGAMLPIGVRKLVFDNIVPWMVMPIVCILAQANFPLNASVCCLHSFMILVSENKRLIIDGNSCNDIHVKYFTQEKNKLPKTLYQLSDNSIYAYLQVPTIINRWL